MPSHTRGSRLILAMLWMFASLAVTAHADVTTTGSVTNPPPVGGGSAPSTDVIVGDENASVDSFIGTMQVDGGTSLIRDRLIIGDEEEYIGDVIVTGAGTIVEVDSSFSSNPALQIGHEGTGYLTISEQAVVDVSNSNGHIVLGRDAGSEGFVHVDGRLTQLRFGDDLAVGNSGYGELKLTDGALLYTTDYSGSTARIGASVTGIGRIELDGARTLWQLPQTVSIGTAGVGTLRIADGATADGDDGGVGSITVGAQGVVELADDGRLLSESITVSGRIVGDGLVTGAITVDSGGELGALAGEKLRFTGAVDNAGIVNVSGISTSRAEVEFVGDLTNSGGSPLDGRIAVADGVIRFQQPLTNQGTLASTSGVTDFHGDITNATSGTIAIGGGSHATFYGNMDVSAGTLNIAEGSTALFLNDISLASNSSTAIQLDSSAQQVLFNAPLQTTGSSSLAGNLELDFVRNADPKSYEPIMVVSAAGGVNGVFSTVSNVSGEPNIGSSEGLAVTYSSTSVDVTRALLGDANLDQQVNVLGDAFTMVRNLGTTGGATWVNGDFNGDGAVNVLGDAFLLVGNLGTSAGGSAIATSIPEPGSLACLSLLVLAAASRRPVRTICT